LRGQGGQLAVLHAACARSWSLVPSLSSVSGVRFASLSGSMCMASSRRVVLTQSVSAPLTHWFGSTASLCTTFFLWGFTWGFLNMTGYYGTRYAACNINAFWDTVTAGYVLSPGALFVLAGKESSIRRYKLDHWALGKLGKRRNSPVQPTSA
jgi:hypothetical protein